MNRYLIIAALWAASLAAVGFWQYHSGQSSERLVWSEREAIQLTSAANEINRLNDEARAKEQQQAAEYAALDKSFTEKQRNEKIKSDRIISDISSGYIRLRDRAASVQTCSSETGTAAEDSGTIAGSGGAELSPELAGFLVREAVRADGIVEKLAALQEAAAICEK